MASFLDLAQDVLSQGITAYRDVQTAKYGANEPTPNNRGANNVTQPAGEPAYSPFADTIAATFSNPLNIVLLLVALGGVIYLVRR